MISRYLTSHIVDFINMSLPHKNVLIVDGVRQVGKTTLIIEALKKSKKNFLEINLEKQKTIRKFIDDTTDFSQFELLLKREFKFSPGHNTILFIDEANESVQLGAYIRQMKEDWIEQTVILSGSMMQRIFRDKKTRIPVGRYQTLTVQPFTFHEFLLACEIKNSPLAKYGLFETLQDLDLIDKVTANDHDSLICLLDHYLTCGGLPEICLKYLNSPDPNIIQNNHIEYLEVLKDDFLRFFPEEYANLFDRAITSVANLLSQPYKKTAMINHNNNLADNVLSIFEKWKVILKIEQKTHNPTSSNSFYPKRYLFDCGISKTKRETGFPPIHLINTLNAKQREPLGGLIEQLVCNELFLKHKGLCGFREKNYEIDFIVKYNNQIIPIECKASLKSNKNQYRSLDLYHQSYGNHQAVIVSLAPFSVVKRKGYLIYHIPVYSMAHFGVLCDGQAPK